VSPSRRRRLPRRSRASRWPRRSRRPRGAAAAAPHRRPRAARAIVGGAAADLAGQFDRFEVASSSGRA
jgi:hypothetical protein